MMRAGCRLSIRLALGFACVAAAPESARAEVDEFRTVMEKWVETRQIIGEEESEWKAERETLRASRDLLRGEKAALEEALAELKESELGNDEERRLLTLERGEYQRANATLEDNIRTMEREILQIAPRLPEPLQRKLDLLLVQIPEDPETADLPLGTRLMNILGVLAQAEKFNSTANFVGETRSVSGDQKVQIRTLYWGLGQAIYVGAQGSVAGVGRPSPTGWEFSDDASLVPQARRFLDIYEGNVDEIDFVNLPVEIR